MFGSGQCGWRGGECGWRGGECGWRGGECMRGLGLGFTNPVRTGEVLDVCVFWMWWCRWGVGRGLGPGSGGVGGVMSV